MTDYDQVDKLWAKRYILDPLTAPEPSQETGPGSSHYNVRLRASRPISIASRPTPHSKTALPASPPSPPRRADSKRASHHHTSSIRRAPSVGSDDDAQDPFADKGASANFFNNPTPPESAGFYKSTSPSTPPAQYHPSNPYSARRSRRTSNLDTHHEEAHSHNTGLVSPPRSPESAVSDSAAAAATARPSPFPSTAAYHSGRLPVRSASARAPGVSRNPDHTRSRSDGHYHHQQQPPRSYRPPGALIQRFPGDMTHRPLDMIRRETRAADRRHRKRFSEADTIDLLDNVGPTYHHDGPYDATLASRNMNKMYSPVEAVKDSNMAALRATPDEFIQDSLIHHRPLQGTGTIPSGGVDARGNRLSYEEGADLMREPDAPGGAYRRYPDVRYHPDDLKGKGEPSYTIERDLKKDKGLAAAENSFEMESNPLMAKSLRRKSVPVGFSSGSNAGADGGEQESLGRQNSTGHRISEGLKRRFGSLRRKKSPSPDQE
ncbi:Pal1 cell morphology [Akanthomyces lecanii RCEF 1005]|uniref:Pal1 cell morphology n=1 Tax=Akanthomyces lecanii RCEF 1005 TaxID=1081108 RepID=A0A168JW69_CORDF|nr:Pal1 cell morphology [Akanthomyces lecanii RCEF 1005]